MGYFHSSAGGVVPCGRNSVVQCGWSRVSPAACRSVPGCCSVSSSPSLRWSKTGSRHGSNNPSSHVQHLRKHIMLTRKIAFPAKIQCEC